MLYIAAPYIPSVRRETTKLGAVRNAPMMLHPRAEGGRGAEADYGGDASGPLQSAAL